MNPVIMHINYAEGPEVQMEAQTIDRTCAMAAELGFDGIEFRGAIPAGFGSDDFAAYAKCISAAKERHGVKQILFGIGTPACSDPDAQVRKASIAQSIEKARIALEICGSTVHNAYAVGIPPVSKDADPRAFELCGSGAISDEQWKLTVDSFQQLGAGLEPLGVVFALETHMRYVHDTPQATKRFVDEVASPAIGINMDYGNTVYFLEYPSVQETIDLYGDRLYYTHLKNSQGAVGLRNRFPTGLGEGQINHRVYLKKLMEVGFNGPIGIEAPRGGDKYWFAEQDIAYYRAVMDAIR